MQKKYLYDFGCAGSDGFLIDPIWVAEQKKAGRVCPNCKWMIDERTNEFDVIHIMDMPKKVHFGRVFSFGGGIILSNELIEIIGRQEVRKWNRILPVNGTRSSSQDGQYSYVVEKEEVGCLRGSDRTKPNLCQVCDRLLYWPLDTRYMLNAYWPPRGRFRSINASGYMDAGTYEQEIKPLKRSRLTAARIRLADEPEDGLPANFEAMKAAVQKRQKPKKR